MRSFGTPWPWLVVAFALVAITAGTLAYGQGDPVVCSELSTHEAVVECYLAELAAAAYVAPGAVALADLAPVALVVLTALAGFGLAGMAGVFR